MAKCHFCYNQAVPNPPSFIWSPLCEHHHKMFDRVREGLGSKILTQIYLCNTDDSQTACVIAPKMAMFGLVSTSCIKFALYVGRIKRGSTDYVRRTCGNSFCTNIRHITVHVSSEPRLPAEQRVELKNQSRKILDIILHPPTTYNCIEPASIGGVPLDEHGYGIVNYQGRTRRIESLILKLHEADIKATPIRLCTTKNCLNSLHYKWGTTKQRDALTGRRLKIENPKLPAELEYDLTQSFHAIMEITDSNMAVTIDHLSKRYNLHPQKIEAALVHRRFK